MSDDASGRERVRTAYIADRIDDFISMAKRGNGVVFHSVHDAARTVALETFDLEEKWIHRYVGHHNDGLEFLCRHKIIAATQCAIMRHAPLRNNEKELSSNSRAKEDGMWTPGIRKLNAVFAHMVALHMLQFWMVKYKQPAESMRCLNSQDLMQTYRENIFWLTGSLVVTTKDDLPRFPFFLLSQFWSMIDRYATVRGGGVFPEYKEEPL